VDVTFHDVLVRSLRLGNTTAADWLPEISASEEGLENAYKIKFGDDRFSRKILRLVADSAADSLRAETFKAGYASETRKVRPVVDVRTAFFASSRLLKIAEWADSDRIEGLGDRYRNAARLAEITGEHYVGRESEDFETVAGAYESAVGGAFDYAVREVVLKLLVDVGAVEERAKKGRSKT
jgi:hypothetical protein